MKKTIKKALSLLLVFMFSTVFITVNAVTADALPGDLDNDQKVTAADARLALRASIGLELFDKTKITLADVDYNGIVTAADARMILRASVGSEDLNPDIYFNAIEGTLNAAPRWYAPELYDTDVVWDKNEVMNYYGKDLMPLYIPEGFVAAAGNGTAKVILEKNGSVVKDTVVLSFRQDDNEYGRPKQTENAAAVKGFSVTASKIGLLNDCVYVLPENEVKTSNIGGTSVTFGYRSVPYGPYTSDTHEPSGYYDLYVADFEHDGIKYEIVAEQMEAEEVVKVVSSVIYN